MGYGTTVLVHKKTDAARAYSQRAATALQDDRFSLPLCYRLMLVSMMGSPSAAPVDRHALIFGVFKAMDDDDSLTLDREEFMSIFS